MRASGADLPGGTIESTVPDRGEAPAPDRAPPARERILAAANELFYRQGIRAVGIESVIEAAGVAKMSLYRCFPSKDALIVAFLENRDRAYWAWWDKVVARHPGEPRRQLRAIFAELGHRTTREGYRGCPFVNTSSEFPEPGHPGRKVIERHTGELRRRLGALAREIGAADPRALADQLILLVEGAYASSQTMGPSGPAWQIEAAAEALIAAQLVDDTTPP